MPNETTQRHSPPNAPPNGDADPIAFAASVLAAGETTVPDELRAAAADARAVLDAQPVPTDGRMVEPPDHPALTRKRFDAEGNVVEDPIAAPPPAPETTEDEGNRFVRSLGDALARSLPPDLGFTLFLWSKGKRGFRGYISNGPRGDMIGVVLEWLGRAGEPLPPGKSPLAWRKRLWGALKPLGAKLPYLAKGKKPPTVAVDPNALHLALVDGETALAKVEQLEAQVGAMLRDAALGALWRAIHVWQRAQFGEVRSGIGPAAHLRREAVEIEDAAVAFAHAVAADVAAPPVAERDPETQRALAGDVMRTLDALLDECADGYHLLVAVVERAVETINRLAAAENPDAEPLDARTVFASFVDRKLSANKARTWPSAPDAAGVYEHVKGDAIEAGAWAAVREDEAARDRAGAVGHEPADETDPNDNPSAGSNGDDA